MITEVPYPAKEIREKIKKAKVQEQVNPRRSVMGSFRPVHAHKNLIFLA